MVTKVFSSFDRGWMDSGWILGLIQGVLAICSVQGGCAELSNVCKPAGTREKGCSDGLACGPCSVRRGEERTSSQLRGHGPGTEGPGHPVLRISLPTPQPKVKQALAQSFVICKAQTRTEKKNPKCTKYSLEEMQRRVMVRISLSEDEEARGMDGFCAQSWMSPCMAGEVSRCDFVERRPARSALSNLIVCQLQSQHCYGVIFIPT